MVSLVNFMVILITFRVMFKIQLAHNGDKRETMHYNDVEDQP